MIEQAKKTMFILYFRLGFEMFFSSFFIRFQSNFFMFIVLRCSFTFCSASLIFRLLDSFMQCEYLSTLFPEIDEPELDRNINRTFIVVHSAPVSQCDFIFDIVCQCTEKKEKKTDTNCQTQRADVTMRFHLFSVKTEEEKNELRLEYQKRKSK